MATTVLVFMTLKLLWGRSVSTWEQIARKHQTLNKAKIKGPHACLIKHLGFTWGVNGAV